MIGLLFNSVYMIVDGVFIGHRLGTASILRLMEAEEELNRQIDTLVDTKIEIGKLIDRVHNETYRLILEKRYLCFMNWDRIAEELHYSRRWVLSRHERALEVADKLLREKEGIA